MATVKTRKASREPRFKLNLKLTAKFKAGHCSQRYILRHGRVEIGRPCASILTSVLGLRDHPKGLQLSIFIRTKPEKFKGARNLSGSFLPVYHFDLSNDAARRYEDSAVCCLTIYTRGYGNGGRFQVAKSVIKKLGLETDKPYKFYVKTKVLA